MDWQPVVNQLEVVGAESLGEFWFPLVLWTVLTILTLSILNRWNRGAALYHYHIRAALLLGLPAGLFALYFAGWIEQQLAETPVFITPVWRLESPLTVTTETAEMASIEWIPFLIGAGMLVLAVIAFWKVVQLLADSVRLISYRNGVKGGTLEPKKLSPANRKLLRSSRFSPSVVCSPAAEVPFTYGWIRPLIVIPAMLNASPVKLNLAVRHELIHIRRGDYLLNMLITLTKALFWFHPLIYSLLNQIRTYREISCDQAVLEDGKISRKAYAQLLYELAPRSNRSKNVVLSMSVEPSNLKQRIKIMFSSTTKQPLWKSIGVFIAVIIGTSLTMSCSDMQSGAANAELEDQREMIELTDPDEMPLYIVDGEEIDPDQTSNILQSLDPQNIESINVLKGENAIKQYGDKAEQGVLLITTKKGMDENHLNNESPPRPPASEETETDRKGDESPSPPTAEDAVKKEGEDFFTVVEEMPELQGGLESVQEHLNYPEEAREAGVEGRVVVQFIVDENGEVRDEQVVRGIGSGCDEAALKAVKQVKFTPGKTRGEPVPVQYALPIIFKL